MIIKRKLYSEDKNQEPVKKERFASIKKGINYAKTHTFKETITTAGKGIGRYIKKNPDEAIIWPGSYAVPLGLGYYAKKKGKGALAAIVASTSLLPIGEGYIAAKKGIQAWRKNKKDDNKA